MEPTSVTPRPRMMLRVLLGLLLCSSVVLIYLASMPASLRLSADPVPTTAIVPDCRLGFAYAGGIAVPAATMPAFRVGIYYNYPNNRTVTPEYYGQKRIQLVRVHNRMLGSGGYYWGTPYMTTPTGTAAWEYHGGGATATAWAAEIARQASIYPGTLWKVVHPFSSSLVRVCK